MKCRPGFLRHDGHGSRPAKRIEDHVAPVAVEFNQAVDQLFGKWGGMSVSLWLGVFVPGRVGYKLFKNG